MSGSDLYSSLRALRKARGWSVGELSDASGVPASSIRDLESGRGVPTVPRLISIASAFGVRRSTLREWLSLASQDPRMQFDLSDLPEDRRAPALLFLVDLQCR